MSSNDLEYLWLSMVYNGMYGWCISKTTNCKVTLQQRELIE